MKAARQVGDAIRAPQDEELDAVPDDAQPTLLDVLQGGPQEDWPAWQTATSTEWKSSSASA